MSYYYINLIINIILFISYINCIKYPINENIEKNESDKEHSIEIESENQLYDYLNNNNYVISLFYKDKEDYIDIFNKASTFKNFNQWIFVKISCLNHKILCKQFNITNYPTYKAFLFSKEIEIYIQSIKNNIGNFLELLSKLSSNPIINIKEGNIISSKEIFYKNYGTFSPIVEYNPNNNEFISCIYILAKKKYLQYFYFGIQTIKNEVNKKKEKIIFDYDNNPISIEWKRDCDNIEKFLNNNLYNLINKINIEFIEELNLRKENILFILYANIKNKKINNFIFNNYKAIAHDNREIIFGYVDINNTKEISNKLKNKINNDNNDNEGNNIQIFVYNFHEDIYYIHPVKYDIDKFENKEIEKEIYKLVIRISMLKFTTGSFVKDISKKFGIKNINYVNIFFIIIIICPIILIFCIKFLSNKNDYYKPKKE